MVIISLGQEHRRTQRDRKVKLLQVNTNTTAKFLNLKLRFCSVQIGFCLYRANDRHTRLTAEHFQYHHDEGTSGPYINYREVFARFELRDLVHI